MPSRAAFRVEPRRLSRPGLDVEAWVEGIKALARRNVESDALRIAWSRRFNVPRHPRFEDYTPEEALLEAWEFHYHENPDSVELKGISRRRNPATGFVYYVTGDPLIDRMEESFGRGEVPDMSELSAVRGGRDIFREPVFTHDRSGRGFAVGQTVSAQHGLEGVKTTPSGERITAGGAKVTHTDFTSDEWIRKRLAEDVALKALADKLGVKDG